MMNTNLIALASGLSDQDLLARIAALAGKEREASVELVAHLAELDTRSSLYSAHGYGSLFTYCTDVLRLSEDAACNRIYAARACRRFPVILDALASGALSLTTVRMLNPHLTPENHEAMLARASGRSRREIEALIAELAPRPDVPSSIRKLPGVAPPAELVAATAPPPAIEVKPTTVGPPEPPPPTSVPVALRATPVQPSRRRRPSVTASSSRSARRATTSCGAFRHFCVARSRMVMPARSSIGRSPSFWKGSKRRSWARRRNRGCLAAPSVPGRIANSRAASLRVTRRATSSDRRGGTMGANAPSSSKDGRRCTERAFLEFHHIRPYALGGPTSADNISLRCRRHNQYEAELVFGRRTRDLEGDS